MEQQLRGRQGRLDFLKLWTTIADVICDNGHQIDILPPDTFHPISASILRHALTKSTASVGKLLSCIGLEPTCFSTKPRAHGQTPVRMQDVMIQAGSVYAKVLSRCGSRASFPMAMSQVPAAVPGHQASTGEVAWEFAGIESDLDMTESSSEIEPITRAVLEEPVARAFRHEVKSLVERWVARVEKECGWAASMHWASAAASVAERFVATAGPPTSCECVACGVAAVTLSYRSVCLDDADFVRAVRLERGVPPEKLVEAQLKIWRTLGHSMPLGPP
jgi:hypothetical protein